MVLQQDKPIKIWGWANPGETVSVDFAGQRQTATASPDGDWAVEFPATSSGGRFRWTFQPRGNRSVLKIFSSAKCGFAPVNQT
ncbi:MAG: hypothetical protein R3C26_18875 [Calditrichia bacterium]